VIVGGRLPGQLGQTLSLCGKPLGIYGRLGKTGVRPFDESYFLSFEALADLVAFCRELGAKARDKPGTPGVGAGLEHDGANVCPPDLEPNRASAFLLQLSPGAEIEEVKFALAQLSDVKIVEGNNILTSSRQALNSLPIGIALFTALQITALLILVSLLFSAIVQERYREVGLLAAIVAVTVSALLGVIGAFVPAWRVRRMAPHTLIQSESPAR